MFWHTREPNPEWDTALQKLATREDRATWLHLVWEPGEPYDPVQRWEIYELLPPHIVNPTWLEEFKRPPPRMDGQWIDDDEVVGGKRWESASLVSRMQYDLWTQYHRWPQRLWVVQGEGGGHLRRLTRHQEASFELHNPGMLWPAPGELAYADPDERTWDALRLRERLMYREYQLDRWELSVDQSGRDDTQVLEDQRQVLNQQIDSWLEEQFYSIKQVMPRDALKEAWEDAPSDGQVDEEAIEQEFMES